MSLTITDAGTVTARCTGFDLLLRLATGQPVTARDALDVLYREAVIECPARADRVARIHARNRALQQAACVLGADNPGAWVLAHRLESAIERFSTRVWPRLRAGLHRGELSPADAALYRAFLTGQRVPRTQRRLYDLLTI